MGVGPGLWASLLNFSCKVFSEVAGSVEYLSALEFARGTLEGIMDQ